MSDKMAEDFVLQLANLPGSFGDGKKGPRRVATAQGAAFYGQPIGTIITKDMIDAKRKENASKGVKPDKGMLTKGGDSNQGTPASANPAGGGDSAAGGAAASGGGKNYPTGGNKNSQTSYAAPGIDSTPPAWMDNASSAPAQNLVEGISTSSLSGPKKFTVGSSTFNAPEGSRLIRPKNGNAVAFIVTPDKKIHTFTEKGEVQMAEVAQEVFSGIFGDKVKPDNVSYAEEEFDSSADVGLDKLSPGQKLYDSEGNDIFTKGETGWTHSELGVPVSEEDIKPLYDSGELDTGKPANEEEVDSFDYGDDEESEISFADMTASEFVDFLDSMDDGEHLYVVSASFDEEGGEAEEYAELTKNSDGSWTSELGGTMKPSSMAFVKGKFRTVEPADLNKKGTLFAETKQKKIDQAKLEADQAASKAAAANPNLTPEQQKAAKGKDLLDRLLADADSTKKAYEDAAGITAENEKKAAEDKAAQVAQKKKADADSLASAAATAEKEQDSFDSAVAALSPYEKKKIEGSFLGSGADIVFYKHALPGSQMYNYNDGHTYTTQGDGKWHNELSGKSASPQGGVGWLVKKNTLVSEEEWTPANENSRDQVGDIPSHDFLNDPPIGASITAPGGKTNFHYHPLNGWVTEGAPWVTNTNNQKEFAAKGHNKIVSLPTGDPALKTGQPLKTDSDYAVLAELAAPGTTIHLVLNNANGKKSKTDTYTLDDQGVWVGTSGYKTYAPKSVIQTYGESFYVGHVAPTDTPQKELGSGDQPTVAWMEQAPVGAGVLNVNVGHLFVKKENGLWGPAGKEGAFSPQSIFDVMGPELSIGDKDENWEDHVKSSFKNAGDVASYDDVLNAPVGTKFKYTKKDGSQSDYSKLADDNILMPAGVIQPVKHWKDSVDKGKVSFAETTEIATDIQSTPDPYIPTVDFPEPTVTPTGDDAQDKKTLEDVYQEMDEWEMELLGVSLEQASAEDDGIPTIDLNDPQYGGYGPGDFATVEQLEQAPPGTQVDTGYEIYVKRNGDDWSTLNTPDTFISSEQLSGYGDGPQFIDYTPDDEPFITGKVSLEEMLKSPIGTQISTESGGDIDNWTKVDGGFWHLDSSDMGSQEEFSSTELNAHSDASTFTFMPEPELEKTIEETLADISEKNVDFKLDGVPNMSISKLEVYEAIESLESHSHGSPVYGLKKLDDTHPIKGYQTEFIEAAKSAYPKHSPKQALLKLLKSKVDVADSFDQINEVDNPLVHLGNSKPAKNAFGVTGGDFSQSDIESAISIIEGYGGKLYKSQLTKADNPLGVLDFNTLVGANKDKLEQKKQVLDFLKESIKSLPPVEKTSPTVLDVAKPASPHKRSVTAPTAAAPFGHWAAADDSDLDNLLNSHNEGATVLVDGEEWYVAHNGDSYQWALDGEGWADSQTLFEKAADNDGIVETWQPHVDGVEIDLESTLDGMVEGEKVVLGAGEDAQAFTKDADGYWNSDEFSNWSSYDLLASGSLLYHVSPSPMSHKSVSSEDVDSLPVGTKIIVQAKWSDHKNLSSHLLEKTDAAHWEEDNTSSSYSSTAVKLQANSGLVYLYSTPDNTTTNKDITTEEEFNALPIGSTVVVIEKYPYTKQGDNLWVADDDGSEMKNSDFYTDLGNIVLVSKPNELPEQYVAPAALQSKADADGVVPAEQKHHNLLPGKYISKNGSGVVFEVYADGSGTLLQPSGKVDTYTAAMLGHSSNSLLGNPDYWTYQGPQIGDKPSPQTPTSAAKSKKPANKLDPKDIPDGNYYMGDSSNPDTLVWNADGGVVTQYNTDGSTEIVSATKVKNAAFKASMLDKWGNTKFVPAGLDTSVVFFNKETPVQSLKSLRKAVDSDELTITSSSWKSIFGTYGVYPNSNFVPYVNVTQGDQTPASYRAAVKQSIDGVLGDPSSYTDIDLESIDGFDWAPGTGKAHFPIDLVPEFGYDIPWYGTSTGMKNKIQKVADNFGDGKTIGQHVTGMPVADRSAWLKAYTEGDFSKMYDIEVKAAIKQGKAHVGGWKHPGYPSNSKVNKISWAPAFAGEKAVTDTVPNPMDLTVANVVSSPIESVNNYLVSAGMSYSAYLTPTERRLWVSLHLSKKQFAVNGLSNKAYQAMQAGDVPAGPAAVWTDNIPESKSYTSLFEGNMYPTAGWTPASAKEWVSDFAAGKATVVKPDGSKGSIAEYNSVFQAIQTPYPDLDTVKAVSLYFQKLSDEKATSDSKPIFSLASSQNVKKTNHPVYNVVDQFGKKYIFKTAAKDVNGSKYRAEVEAAAGDISRAFGASAPKIWVETFNGKLGTMQEDFPHVKNLSGFSWKSADSKQTIDVANEHLVDWMLDQDDNWATNSLIGPDGHVVGIDKGRSFANYGSWNGMVSHSGMDVSTHLVYSDLYQSIIDKSISKEVADATWLAVRKRADRMSKVDDGKLLEMLHAATDSRKNWNIDYVIDGKKVPQTQQGFFDAFFDRKAKLPGQVETLWKDIYAKAGYGELPVPPKSFLGDGQHSGLDDVNFHETTLKVGSSGSATLLGSSNLIGGTVLAHKVKNSDGSTDVDAVMHLAPKKQGEVLSWFKANSDGSALSSDKADSTMFSSSEYDNNFGNKYVAAAKTIGAHAEDGKYNAGTLQNYESAKGQIQKDLAHWSSTLEPGPDEMVTFPSGTKVPYGHVDQYKLMLDHYDSESLVLDTALTNKVKPEKNVSKFQPYQLHDSNIIYTDTTGQKMVKLGNGKWIYSNGATVAIIDNDVAESTYSDPNQVWSKWKDVPEAPKIVYQATVGPAKTRAGNLKDFELTLTGDYVTNGNGGKEYEVTLPTGEKIYFRNAAGTGTSRSQHGRLSYRLSNVSTASDAAQGTQNVQAWLSDNLGLSLEAADQDSAELLYWREMYGVLENRKHAPGSAWAKAKADLDVKVAAVGGPSNQFLENFADSSSVEEQNEFFRDLWGKHFGVEKVNKMIEDQGYLPYYENFDLRHKDTISGNPQWTRFDVDLNDFSKKDVMLVSSNTSANGPLELVKSGGALSTEERIRVLGQYIGGMSSGADQNYGSANSIFTRIKPSSAHSGFSYIYHPRTMLRTRTYSFNGDHYGRLDDRKSGSPSNPLDSWMKFTGGNNESMIPHAAALLGDLEIIIFDNANLRNEAIQELKKLGFEKIRGVPIEDRLVMRQDLAKAIDKIRKTWYR